VLLPVRELVGVLVCDALGGPSDRVRAGVGPAVFENDTDGLGVPVLLAVGVFEGVEVAVPVCVAVPDGVPVCVPVWLAVWLGVCVGDDVLDCVTAADGLGVCVPDCVGV